MIRLSRKKMRKGALRRQGEAAHGTAPRPCILHCGAWMAMHIAAPQRGCPQRLVGRTQERRPRALRRVVSAQNRNVSAEER